VLSLFQWEMMNWSDTASSSYILSQCITYGWYIGVLQSKTLKLLINSYGSYSRRIWSPSWNTMSVHS
jgi:hypothetical protein